MKTLLYFSAAASLLLLSLNLESGTACSFEEEYIHSDTAAMILGRNFLGLATCQLAYGKDVVNLKDVPPIPFGRKLIEYARDNDMLLVLELPLTIQEMRRRLLTKGPGKRVDFKLLESYDRDGSGWYEYDSVFTEEKAVLKPRWKLVEKNVIPGSNGGGAPSKESCYYTQIKFAIQKTNKLKEMGLLPRQSEFEEAISEYMSLKDSLVSYFDDDGFAKYFGNSPPGSHFTAPLKLSFVRLFRETAPQIFHRMALSMFQNRERLLSDVYVWTSSVAPGIDKNREHFNYVFIGYFTEDGMLLYKHRPAIPSWDFPGWIGNKDPFGQKWKNIGTVFFVL